MLSLNTRKIIQDIKKNSVLSPISKKFLDEQTDEQNDFGFDAIWDNELSDAEDLNVSDVLSHTIFDTNFI